MTFQEAERTYKDLKAQHAGGKLGDADFEAQVGKLKLQDQQGRWWQIGVQTGEWYMHDGQKWNKAKPPADAPAIPAPPSITDSVVMALEKDAAQKEAPANGDKKPAGRATVAPTRLFSSKPAGREGGLPMPLLIGIIAGVALVVILIAVGAMYFLGVFGGPTTAKATSTPTRIAGLASPTIMVPTVRPTDVPTPLPSPTIIAAPTITPTLAAPPTATRRPATTPVTKVTVVPTKACVAASPTPAVPAGVYATKVEPWPVAKLSIGSEKVTTGFKVTFFNNTGSLQSFKKWYVRVFQCPEQCTGDTAFKNSYGESLKADVNIAAGAAVEITAQPHVNFGPGRCDYIAVPYYTGDNEIPVPFQAIKGGGLYQTFSVCN